MKVLSLVYVLILITLSNLHINNVSCFNFANINEIKNLKQSKFGANLVETVSLTLSNNGNLSSVQKMLNDLLYKSNKDQDTADKTWLVESKQLKTRIAGLQKEIESLRLSERSYQQRKGTITKRVKANMKNISDFKTQKEQNIKDISLAKSNRQTQHDIFQTSIDNQNNLINALEIVISQLEKLSQDLEKEKPVEVKEAAKTNDATKNTTENTKEDKDADILKDLTSTSTNEIINDNKASETTTKLKDANSNKAATSFLQVSDLLNNQSAFVTNLISLADSNDSQSIAKLITYLRDLQNACKSSLNDDEEFERDSIKGYTNLLSILETDTNKINEGITDLSNLIKQDNYALKSVELKMSQIVTLSTSKQSEHKQTKTEWNNKDTQIKTESEQRESEMKQIEELKKVVKSNLEGISDFLKTK